MAKLPSSADLGAPVSARSGRPIASVDTSAVQKGVIQLGKGLSSLGEAGLAYAKHQEAAEDYDTELKFRQFRFDQERDLDEQMRSVEPERATSFADEWTGGYKERAGQFLETVPPHLRGKYQLKIHETERDLYRPAQVFTRTEQKRQSTAKLDDFIDNSLVKSGNLERGRTELDELIERNPWLSPVEKDELRREKLKRFEQLHVKSMIERGENLDAIIRDLGGEPLDDMENPETRAKPFEGTAPGPRTHAGFSPASITARLETGQKDPLKGVASIAKDSNDSRSYGNFGLNSQGSAQQFVREYGDALGLSGEPGTDEFDRSWKAAAASDPEGLHQAELHWWSKTIEPRIVNDLGSSGVSAEVATDPRVKAYFADRLIQYGPASIGDHEERVKSAFDASGGNVEAFLRNMTEADRENLQRDFPSALRSGVYSQRGHDTRTYGRLNLALAGGGEQASLPTATDSYAGPYKNLSGEERLQLMHAARAGIKRQAAEVGEEVRSFETMAEKGFSPQPEQLDALRSKVTRIADPEVKQTFREAEAILRWQDVARRASPEELDTFLRTETSRLRDGGATRFDAKRLELADKLLSNMRRELKEDALGWADRVGLVKIQPIDFASPEAAQASLAARVTQAEAVARRYGIEPKYLRPDEQQKLAATVEQGGDQTLSVTSMIAATAGDRAPAILGEVFKQSPSAAIIGGLVAETGINSASRDAADGLALSKQPGFQSVAPPAREARTQITEVMGSALSGMPKTETAMINAANMIYEIRARKQGLTEFDNSVWQQGLRELVGERVIDGKTYGGIVDANPSTWGTRNIIIPPFMAQDGWREAIDTLQPADLERSGLGIPAGGDGKPIPINRWKGATLVQTGDGRYALSLGDPDTPGEERWVVRHDAPGELFEIDLRKLRPTLQIRRPDLFIGEGNSFDMVNPETRPYPSE